MKEIANFYKPEELKSRYPDIVPVYQNAFAGEPWFEKTKCIDINVECNNRSGIFCPLGLREKCPTTEKFLDETAYTEQELVDTFESLNKTRPVSWYMEKNELGLTLVSIAWLGTPSKIIEEKYSGDTNILSWLTEKVGESEIIWLDEIFADRIKKPTKNLVNFRQMCLEFSNQLQKNIIALRTISKQVVGATTRDFPEQRRIYERNIDVPDRRDFIIISL